jgi:hypothetical protein
MELREDVTQAGPRHLTAQDGVAALIDPMELKDVLRQINSHTCNPCHVDSLLLVVVGSHRGPVEPMLPNSGESIPLEKVSQRRSRVMLKTGEAYLVKRWMDIEGLARGTVRLGAPGLAGENNSLFEHPEVLPAATPYGTFGYIVAINRVFSQPASKRVRDSGFS